MRLPSTIRRFALLTLTLLACGSIGLNAQPVITEFLASNRANLADADGAYSDWVEIHNPGDEDLDLTGWYLTDAANNRTKWRFPAVTIRAGGYLVVFASSKDRRDPTAELHTNFALSAGGEYLGLIRPDGTTAAFEYSPEFPSQTDDVSYGVFPLAGGGFGEAGFMPLPTPGKVNVRPETAPALGRVTLSRASGPFGSEFSLELTGAGAGQVIRYVQHHPTVGGEVPPELDASSTAYATPLLIDRSVVIRAAVFAPDGSARGEITSAYFARIASDAATFTGKLPLLVIDSLASGPLDKDAIDHPAWMYVYGSRPGGTPVFGSAPDLITPLTATVRGSSSSFFPKKGYNIKITDDNGRKQAQPLLGLPAHDRWALVAPWNYDPACINNAFVYALSNRLGRWAARTRFAEVFFNADGGAVEAADYAGIYVLTDRLEVGAARIAIHALTPAEVEGPELTGGYVFKIDAPDYDEFSWTTERGIPAEPLTAIVLAAPKAGDIAPAQRAYLVDQVQQMENALVADRDAGFAQRTYLDYIDRASWVDHHILNTFAGNPDAFERSAYFTKPRNGRIQAGPVWDFDRALGSDQDERSARWDVWSGYGAADVWNTGWWGLLARDPEFMQDWVDRWQALRRTTLAETSLVELASSLANEVGVDAAARDAARWPGKINPHGTFTAEVEYLRGWIGQRAQWIDRQFAAPPTVKVDGVNLVFTAPAGSRLIYTTDGSDPRALGGAVAPNAILSSTPVTVSASLNLQVRCYRDEMKGVFPGSPWSSAVGGANSTPLAPAARIVNLSVSTLVGGGGLEVVTGVVVADTNAKRYLVRAVGPGLAAFGAEGFLPDPELSIVSGGGMELARNSGWQDGPDAALIPELSRAVGAFQLAPGSRDAALVSRMPAGSFSIHATSATDQIGGGLMELYELDANGRTVNLSTRTYVGPGERALVGGFVLQGTAHKRVLIRAVGPTLALLGVANVLADPVLRVFAGANQIADNDRWEASANAEAVRAASRQVGAFQLAANSEDAAVLVTLPPRAYTLEVTGKGGAEGVLLLEIYEVP